MRIIRVEIQNYKAFREAEPFEIGGKNVLIYGNNGSGKTSFAHALQSLIQSSTKTPEQISQAFNPSNNGCIINLDSRADGVCYVRIFTDNNATYSYSLGGNTQADVILREANQVSDFMNYRLLSRFYNFRETQEADIFGVLRDEFFPFWTDPAKQITYSDWYAKLWDDFVIKGIVKTRRNSQPFRQYENQLNEFNDTLRRQLADIGAIATRKLSDTLLPGEEIEVDLDFQSGMRVSRDNPKRLQEPVIFLSLAVSDCPVSRPHSFLNEARLTALALAIRFAAFETRPQRVSDFKILVLDDLLISLDMSVRLRVIQELINSYGDYQKFILTHDIGFYRFLKQVFEIEGEHQVDWKCFEMYENIIEGKSRPYIKPADDLLVKAKKFLDNNEFDACAVFLRKKAEEMIRIYYDPTLELIAQNHIQENLAIALAQVSKELHNQRLTEFIKLLDTQAYTLDMVQRLISAPFESDDLPQAEIGQINSFRRNVLRFIKKYYEHREEYRNESDELAKLAKRVSQARSVVLNPGAHSNDVNIHIGELKQAYNDLLEFDKKVKNRRW